MPSVVFRESGLKQAIWILRFCSLGGDDRHAYCGYKEDETQQPETWDHSTRMLAPRIGTYWESHSKNVGEGFAGCLPRSFIRNRPSTQTGSHADQAGCRESIRSHRNFYW